MPDTDRILIDPAPDELASALADAVATSNRDGRVRRLDWPPPSLAAFLEQWRTEREGRQQWNGGLARAAGGDTRTVAAAYWWTDYGGRKHVRVVGRRGPFSSAQLANLLDPTGERPLVWLVRPNDVYFRQEGERWLPWAACRCGAAGPPESIGWMGETCGPCHDRLAMGETPPGHDDRRRSVLEGGEKNLEGLTFLNDNRLLTAGREVREWDLIAGTSRTLFRHWRDHVQGLTVAPDGGSFAVNLSYRSAAVCDGVSGAVLAELNVPRSLSYLAYRPDGLQLAVRLPEEVVFYDTAGWAERKRLTGLGSWGPLAWSPDGRLLAVGVRNTVRVLDAESGNGVGPELAGLDDGVIALAFTADGTALFTLTSFGGGTLRVWDWPSGRERFRRNRVGMRLAFSPDGSLLVTGGIHSWSAGDEKLRLWNVADMRLLGVYAWHAGKIRAVAFSPDGRWLATSGDDPYLKLWPVPALRGGPPCPTPTAS